MRAFPLVGIAALLVAGCGSARNGGSAGASLAGTSVAATTSSAAAAAPRPAIPSVVVSQPARGAFLPSGPVTVAGTVTTGSSLASLTVQGVPVTADASGNFSTVVTLDEGVAPILITAIDATGNRTDRTLSVETGSYLPASSIVPGALAGRINAGAFQLLQKLAGAEMAAIQSTVATSLQAVNPVFSGYTVTVSIASVSFGTPTIAIGSSAQGLDLNVTVPQIDLAVAVNDSLGFQITTGTITADSATIAAVAQLGITSSGAIDVQVPTANVAFQNFNLSLGGAFSFLGPIASPVALPLLTSQIQSLIQTSGPAAIAKLISQTTTLNLGATPLTFSYALESIATDDQGIAFSVGTDLALPPDPSYPLSPGSLDTTGALPQAASTLPTAVLSVSETTINRVLQQAWQSGFLATTVRPGALAQSLGVALPFGSTAQDLASFLPDLQGAIPTQYLAQPIVYTIRSALPPTAKLMANVPDPLRLRFGEYSVTASIDTGNGQLLDVFTISLFAEVQLGLTIQNGSLVPDMTTLPSPILHTDLVSSPLVPLGAAYIESYVDAMIPALMGGLISQLPPIPVPQLPAGLSLTSVTLHTDGPSGSYLTLEVELQ